MMAVTTTHNQGVVQIPVARSKALVRAMWWSVSALLTGLVAYLIYSSLDFRPSPITNRIVEYSLALVALPVPGAALFSALKALLWAGLWLWPGSVGIFADEQALTFKLGPFGIQVYDAARLDVRYPFEFSSDIEDGGFEAFLPEEEQVARFLPRLLHPDGDGALNLVILCFVSGDESQIAAALRPVIQQWRSHESVREKFLSEPHP